MVILQRSEIRRNRVLYLLSPVLSLALLIWIGAEYSSYSQPAQLLFVLLAAAAVVAVVISLLQLWAFPKRSHALIIQQDDAMIIATNALHDGYKLRFLRDVLSENVVSLSDEDRVRWKRLEQDGYVPTLRVRNARKVLVLKLCTLIFDDVYAVDSANRWEHYDCSSTSEPSFHKREMPPLRAWKDSGNVSA